MAVFISLAPNLTEETGHGIIYQHCLKDAAESNGFSFLALFPRHSPFKKLPDYAIPFFHKSRPIRFFDFCRAFSIKAKRRFFFMETFGIFDFLLFSLGAILFHKKTDRIALLFRRGIDSVSYKRKSYIALCKICHFFLKDNFSMMTDSDLIAKDYESVLPIKMTLLPIPHTENLNTSLEDGKVTVFWWPGLPRKSKGWKDIKRFAETLTKKPGVELVAAKQSELPNAILIENHLTREQYVEQFQKSNCILLPYDSLIYRAGTSGIFVEAIIAGKTPFTKPGNWIAHELQKYDLGDLILSWEKPPLVEDLIAIKNKPITKEKLKKMRISYKAFHSPNIFAKTLFLLSAIFLLNAEPPRHIPKEYRKEFKMKGKVQISSAYCDDSRASGSALVYDYPLVESLIQKARDREVCYYGPTDAFLFSALDLFCEEIKGKKIGVIGSTTPWYEAIVLSYGGIPVTIDYNRIISEHPQITTKTIAEYDSNPELFDVILSISSFEHDGLGRYGDPINPQGDLLAMEKTKKMLSEKGLLFLAVPIGIDHIYWNAHRVYGKHRLPLLLSGWETITSFGYTESDLHTFSSGYHQPVFVLKKQTVD